MISHLSSLALIVLSLATRFLTQPVSAETTPPTALDQALQRAGTNRASIVQALNSLPEDQRPGLKFLVENMPDRDLTTLSTAYLVDNVSHAYQAFQKAPWRDRVPMEIFLNDILPYAAVNESRDAWRTKLYDLAAPLVADCQTPSEAAQRLNQKLFSLAGVKYSTKRRRPDQGPLETLDSGIATCTGLSILLVDACRAIGVPARVVGTPLWYNQRGNHTWVEIWDGDWHFTGAAETDPAGLDRGWFTHDASQALKDVPKHAIYASSFAKTGLSFPLVWAPNLQYVSAVNVTERYTPKAKPAGANPDQVRLLVKVLDRPAGQRVAAQVILSDPDHAGAKQTGTSRDESADLNDLLPFQVQRDHHYQIHVTAGALTRQQEFHSGTNAQELLVITLNDTPSIKLASQVCYAPPRVTTDLEPAVESKLKKTLTAYFTASADQQAAWPFPADLDAALAANEPAVRRAAWDAFRQAPIHQSQQQDFATNQVQSGKYLSPYTVKEVGTKPAGGWPLFIAMHGGGGAPKSVNDSQWKHMQIYYKDHPEVGGYLYVALRAPNDTWNGFYDNYVYPLIANLINQFSLFGDIDVNKVFIMGYSHGGYGAFAIGPKIPDRFAAIHASAAAPTDGETTAKTLRNTIFTAMIGEKDTAYGRYERNLRFRDSVDAFRANRQDIYPVTVRVIEGNGHTGLPDRDNIPSMYPAVRNPVPTELTWLMTDDVVTDFFWLRCETPGKQNEIDATCRDNKLTVTTTHVAAASVLLDQRLVDYTQPLTVELNGQSLPSVILKPSLCVLAETLQRRGDPELAFTIRYDLPTSHDK